MSFCTLHAFMLVEFRNQLQLQNYHSWEVFVGLGWGDVKPFHCNLIPANVAHTCPP